MAANIETQVKCEKNDICLGQHSLRVLGSTWKGSNRDSVWIWDHWGTLCNYPRLNRARLSTGVRQGPLILQLYFLGIHQAVVSWRSGAPMFFSAAASANLPNPAPVDLATVTSWLSHQGEVAQRLGAGLE